MSSKGYIKLYRQLQDCWIWDSDEKHNRRSAWIDLLLLANHTDKKIAFNDEIITIKRGQILTSIRKLAERWGWSKSTVVGFLKLLENDNMIVRDSNSSRTLLTIINYEVFQVSETPASTPTRTASGTPTRTVGGTVGRTVAETNNNDNKLKNVKNEKNIYNARFEDFWKTYPRHDDKAKAYRNYIARLNEGYSEQELLTAAENYKAECDKEQRIKKYIKMGSTFLGIDKPFTDYLKGGSDNGNDNTASHGSAEYDPFTM